MEQESKSSGVLQAGLRALRVKKGLSQQKLADQMNVHRESLSRLENGGDARVSTIERVADALGEKLSTVAIAGQHAKNL